MRVFGLQDRACAIFRRIAYGKGSQPVWEATTTDNCLPATAGSLLAVTAVILLTLSTLVGPGSGGELATSAIRT